MDKGDEERERGRYGEERSAARRCKFCFCFPFQFNSMPEHLRAISTPPRGVMRQTLKLAAAADAAGDE